MSVNDAVVFSPLVAKTIGENLSGDHYYFYVEHPDNLNAHLILLRQTLDPDYEFLLSAIGEPYLAYLEQSTFINITLERYCVLVSEVHREVAYHIVSDGIENVSSAVSDSLSNGWKLSGGISAYSSSNHKQAIWRWAK